MAITMRADIAKSMYVGTTAVFKKHLKKQPQEEWKSIFKVKPSTQKEEKYDTIGNLKPAETKAEGSSINYGKIVEGNEVIVANETVANGFSVTMEAKEDEKWNIVPEVKVNELARTMINQREVRTAAVLDAVDSTVGSDGVALAAHNHPLLNNAGTNDNLIEGEFNIDNYEAATKLFNHWKNHQGEKFYTRASSMVLHTDRQSEALAMLQSQLMPFENTNTKNTIPKLKLIFNSYINQLKVHLIDDSIDTFIFQRRKGLTTEYDYDKRDTFNFYFNVHERYKAASINHGFGHVLITGEAGV